MAKNLFQVVMPVSEYGLGYNYTKYLLDSADKGPVVFEVSSYGGDLNQAKLVKKLFADRGDVTVDYFGYNASAATILGHGAANTRIYSDAFFLVHKPLVWVEAWGRMNADDIEAAITELTTQKKDAEVQALSIAKEYCNYAGMSMPDIMALMKEERWLTAQEAVDMGFVNEVIPAVKGKKPVVTNEVLAMISANTLPPLPESSSVTDEEKNLFQKFTSFINQSKHPKIEMKKDLTFINQVLAVEGVNESNGQITLSVEHVMALNTKIKADADSIATITAERDTAVTDKGTAETTLATFTNKVDELDATVKAAATPEAKVAAITAKLASRPGQGAAAPQGGASSQQVTDETDWDSIDDLPHNKEVDNMYFKPKSEK